MMVCTFHLVAITWVYFRSGTVASANSYLFGILTWQSGEHALGAIDLVRAAMLFLALLVVEIPQYRSNNHLIFLQWKWWQQALLYTLLLVVLLAFGGLNEDVPFIYFQF